MKYKVTVEQAKALFKAQDHYRSGNTEAAIDIYEALLKADPNLDAAEANLAVLCERKGWTFKALQVYDSMIRRNPDNAHAHYCKALVLLNDGQFKEGFKEYKWRTKREGVSYVSEKFAAPMWDGEPLYGKKVVVWTDQGIGDEILLGTMLPDLMVEKGNFTIVCSPRMMTSFSRTFPNVRVMNRDMVQAWTDVSYEFDYQVSLTELGMLLRPNEQCFPFDGSYLDWDTGASKQMRDRYKQGDKLVVGLAWHSGNPRHSKAKSIPFEDMKRLLSVPNCTFINLQYGRECEQAYGTKIITDHSVPYHLDMDKVVAQVAAMDLVIAVSSTAVHIAGACGIPVWNIVPKSTEASLWYWLKDREDSPFYRTMKLFRRDSNGLVMQRVEKALTEIACG